MLTYTVVLKKFVIVTHFCVHFDLPYLFLAYIINHGRLNNYNCFQNLIECFYIIRKQINCNKIIILLQNYYRVQIIIRQYTSNLTNDYLFSHIILN